MRKIVNFATVYRRITVLLALITHVTWPWFPLHAVIEENNHDLYAEFRNSLSTAKLMHRILKTRFVRRQIHF